jgi:hypothetical protein
MITNSWTINFFIIGCFGLMLIPGVVYFYREVIASGQGDYNDA